MKRICIFIILFIQYIFLDNYNLHLGNIIINHHIIKSIVFNKTIIIIYYLIEIKTKKIGMIRKTLIHSY